MTGWRNLRRVDDFEGLTLSGVDEFVIDEQTDSVKYKQITRRRGARWPRGLTVVGMTFRLGV